MNPIKDADEIYQKNFKPETWFERALFLSWYCSRGDCKFCYMSAQKDKIKNPKEARRTKASIIAEAILCKNLGWEIEFISGGYDSFEFDEIVDLIRVIKEVSGKKQWINIGVLPEDQLIELKPYLEGFCGAVECMNPRIHDDVCPSKPLKEIEEMFELCDKHKLKKALTLIIGLGESIDDFDTLQSFITKHKIKRITFYALNPQEGTPYDTSPNLNYYAKWIAKTRIEFPRLKIIAGAWIDKPEYFPKLLQAGANAITKIPAIKTFNSEDARLIEESINQAGRTFKGTLTELPDINWDKEVDKLSVNDELKEQVKEKLKQYLSKMSK